MIFDAGRSVYMASFIQFFIVISITYCFYFLHLRQPLAPLPDRLILHTTTHANCPFFTRAPLASSALT
jgi:hypothetical protein